jgi:hypothetical protein
VAERWLNEGARRLYERLGFRAREEDSPFLHMTLVPSPPDDAAGETARTPDGDNVQ